MTWLKRKQISLRKEAILLLMFRCCDKIMRDGLFTHVKTEKEQGTTSGCMRHKTKAAGEEITILTKTVIT